MRILTIALLALSLPAGAAHAARNCNPAPDPGKPQVIVGYGSLMQDESRRRTSPDARAAVPVEVTGFRRGWFARSTGTGPGSTYLGVVPEAGGELNAVAYGLDLPELASTDRRESSYCRLEVASSSIRSLAPDGAGELAGQVWIYVVGSRADPPSERFPIVQSYVDVFLSGCLEQEERFGIAGFSLRCVRTTGGWSDHWVNDRIYPRRPFVFQPRAPQIDRLLSTELAGHWSRIRIEGQDRRAPARRE